METYKIEAVKDQLTDPHIIINKVYQKLILERSHAEIAGVSEEHAVNGLKSFVKDLSQKFIPMIELYENELSSILQLKRTSEKETSALTIINATDEASKDSELRKFNDTPDGGNINLTTDTHISSSERVNVDTGKRERSQTDDRIIEESLTDIDNIMQLEAVGNLPKLISDLYGDIITIIDMNYLTYTF